MDGDLGERVRALAEAAGQDPAILEATLSSGGLPDDLVRAVADVLAETARFAATGGRDGS